MSPDEVLFFLMMMSGWLPPCRAAGLPPRSCLDFSWFVHKFTGTSARIFTVTAFFSIELKKGFQSHIFLHGSVSLVASWLIEHGGACVEWSLLVSLQ